ncbi:hypothetical protein HMPREF9441_02867 [Paraprevotella clara YIT 11840]|uniref:Uncharacterized protein n=1 Tax=Paraprevotella clara YIT 11840 TaxID=762968 RepID=G5SU12_9BACT|nr:hypothetical protein HMPREF9441_02867 [Paraprevotella clara YIT 11840]
MVVLLLDGASICTGAGCKYFCAVCLCFPYISFIFVLSNSYMK